jgi:hypothetical protein
VPVTARLFTVDGNTPADVWAVGMSGGVYHYDGAHWSAINSGVTFNLGGVAHIPGQSDKAIVVGDNNGAAGPALVLTCSLTGCTRDTTVPAVGRLDSVWATSATDYWAVGGSSATNGSILHFTNGTWSANQVAGAVPNTHYHMVQFLSNGEGYAVGESPTPSGPGTIIHYTTTTGWQPVDTGLTFSGPLYGVWFISPQEGWVVGGGAISFAPVILHFHSSTWTAETVTGLPAPTVLNFVSMNADGSGYTVGESGQILYRTAGSTIWHSNYTDPSNGTFYGLWLGAGGITGWAVGDTSPAPGTFSMAHLATPGLWLPVLLR